MNDIGVAVCFFTPSVIPDAHIHRFHHSHFIALSRQTPISHTFGNRKSYCNVLMVRLRIRFVNTVKSA